MYLFPFFTTTIGCNTPCILIELAKSFNALSSKCRRGCSGSAIISYILSSFNLDI